ncbi:MAG: alpha/beta hydrolase [Pseudomonadales bacterium]
MEFNAEGATLYVELDGSTSSPVLLLWPPGNCNLRVWDHLVPKLASRFHVVRVDLRGLGRSSPTEHPETQYTFEQYAADACAVLNHLEILACHVWSQSWGSRPAMAFSALNPERVISAALYAANVDMPDVKAQREGSRLAAERRRAAGISTAPPPDGFQTHQSPEAAQQAVQAMRKFELANVVDKLTMPVLIGTGEHDPNLTSSRAIAESAANIELVILRNVGHNGILEYPELALQTFLKFHDSLPA